MFSFERMLKIWEKYGHMYWNGLGYTLLFAFVVLMGLVLGLVLASGRIGRVQSRDNLAVKALKAVAKFFCTAYVEVFRATPMLVQVFIIYYGLGNVLKLPGLQPQPHVLGHGGRRPQLRGLYVGGHPLRHRRGARPPWRPRAACA